MLPASSRRDSSILPEKWSEFEWKWRAKNKRTEFLIEQLHRPFELKLTLMLRIWFRIEIQNESNRTETEYNKRIDWPLAVECFLCSHLTEFDLPKIHWRWNGSDACLQTWKINIQTSACAWCLFAVRINSQVVSSPSPFDTQNIRWTGATGIVRRWTMASAKCVSVHYRTYADRLCVRWRRVSRKQLDVHFQGSSYVVGALWLRSCKT